ncbi:hypothetical protein G6M17_16535 [Agrobacterium tumefaciens]|uniref:Uncharacterized protein n=1 Tax=Agrobacterium tumefaciens TaxID=358 RepID=A0A546Y250_AGRTU|nr:MULTISPECIES: hypothetical protein [Rhizobium/Agrobacterium group]AQS64824.1 hypothetical protein B0909_21635 [Rhizobium rhizogenes]MCZ7444378.1 hypothetical protein [Rhizobium rhizogenes]MCZ7467362.1 hypothetical protein [Rhizobium rhizogenes]NSX92409.1 hypothetical protein [Agrobacterium tumefaciens]NSZ80774.1 hypothetical protein [Agrobacterium tumefaciens]
MPELRLLLLFIDRLTSEEDCPDKWEGSICFAVAFIRRRILCRLLSTSGLKPGMGGGFRFLHTQLSAKLAAAYATICFRDRQLRCADRTKAFYDLIIPATPDPQARMTTT